MIFKALHMNYSMWKIYMERERPRVANTTLKNKVRGLTPPDIKTYYETILIKTVWYQQKNRQINQ